MRNSKDLGESRPLNPALPQLKPDECGTVVEGVGRLSPLHQDLSVPGHCFHLSFPSSLHWPQCFLPALGVWLCHPHLSWSRDEEEHPGNTGRRKTSEGQSLQSTGPVWVPCRGGHKGQEYPGRERTLSLQQGQASRHLQSFRLLQRCGAILKCLVASLSSFHLSPPL